MVHFLKEEVDFAEVNKLIGALSWGLQKGISDRCQGHMEISHVGWKKY